MTEPSELFVEFFVDDTFRHHYRRNPAALTASRNDAEFALTAKLLRPVVASVATSCLRHGLDGGVTALLAADVLRDHLGDEAVAAAEARRAEAFETLQRLRNEPGPRTVLLADSFARGSQETT